MLGSLVYYYLKNNKQQNCNPQGINSLNNSNIFLITQLYYSRLASIFSSSNNFYSYNNTYLEASFIKILDIFIKNPILYNYILNKLKLGLNKYRIFVFSTLVVILAIISRLQVIIALNIILYLILADRFQGSRSSMLGNQNIGYLPYGRNSQQYTTLIY